MYQVKHLLWFMFNLIATKSDRFLRQAPPRLLEIVPSEAIQMSWLLVPREQFFPFLLF
jgi:hypothetical protein